LYVVTSILLGCSRRDDVAPAAQPAQRSASTTTSAPAPAPTAQEISIDEISGTNPLIVRGRARTFENALSLRVRDERGELLSESHVMSVGESGHHNPYTAELWLTRNPGSRLTVEAFEFSAKDGSIRSLVRRTHASTAELTRAMLMFPTQDCDRLEPFERELPKPVAMARLLVEALLAGPTSAERARGATSPFPAGSAVRSVVMRNGELTVDFNERLQSVGGACAAQAIRASVTQTLERLLTVKRVVITAGGSSALALQP
jgi:hypothetical protein